MNKRLTIYFLVVLFSIFTLSFSVLAQDQEFLDWCASLKEKFDGTTISIAAHTHPSVDAFREMTPEFTELTGIKVRWDTMNELMLRDKVMMEFASHTGAYDVTMVDCVWVGEFATKGIIFNLDNYINDTAFTPEWYDYEGIIPAYREGLTKWDGSVYGLVTAGQTNLLGYRKDLFDKYGIDPNSITSYDRFLELCEFFNGKEPGLYGNAFRGQRGHNVIVTWFTYLYPFGGRLFDDEKNWNVVINSEDAIKSLEYLIQLGKYSPPGFENYNSEEQCAAVARGDVALALDVSACPPYYEPEGSVAKGKMGYLPPPAGPKGDFAANAGWLAGICSDSKNKDAAWAFMVYMTSPQKVKQFLTVGGDINRTETFNDPEIIESIPYAQATLEALNKAYNLIELGVPHWRPPIPEWSKIGEILGFEVNSAIIGEKSAKEALDKAAVEISNLMKEKGYYN